MLLALDTSTAWLGLAVHGVDGLVAAASWQAGIRQSAQCVAEVEHLLARAAVPLPALAGVAVALGPGGFTSLRVGLSVAKGLCLALERPIIGISTLAATAYPYRWVAEKRMLGAVVDLGRGEAAAQWYRHGGPVSDLVLGDAGRIAATAPTGDLLLVGEVEAALQAALAAALGPRALFAGVASPVSRVVGVAALGWERLTSGQVDDVAALRPLYPYRSGQPTFEAP